MRIRQEHRNFTRELKEIIGDQITLVSGYFFWKKDHLDLVLRGDNYTVISKSRITPKKLVRDTENNSLINEVARAFVDAPFGFLNCLFGGTLIYYADYCKGFVIRDKGYNLTFGDHGWGGRTILTYTSKESNIVRLRALLKLVNPTLPEEVFPVLEELVNGYDRAKPNTKNLYLPIAV